MGKEFYPFCGHEFKVTEMEFNEIIKNSKLINESELNDLEKEAFKACVLVVQYT
jgi:hypothetical protein